MVQTIFCCCCTSTQCRYAAYICMYTHFLFQSHWGTHFILEDDWRKGLKKSLGGWKWKRLGNTGLTQIPLFLPHPRSGFVGELIYAYIKSLSSKKNHSYMEINNKERTRAAIQLCPRMHPSGCRTPPAIPSCPSRCSPDPELSTQMLLILSCPHKCSWNSS